MRVAVILHERLGGWYRQLRPRLPGLPVRWLESRSIADLAGNLDGLASPVVLIDLGRWPIDGLLALEMVLDRAPDARVLVMNPESLPDAGDLARELGAALVWPGFAPPPEIAGLITRWVGQALDRTGTAGWSRTTFAESSTEPWGWLAEHLGEPVSTEIPRFPRTGSARPPNHTLPNATFLPTGDHD